MNKFFTLALALLVSGHFSTAQNQKISSPRIYRDSADVLYWNKKIPVYVRLSSTPDGVGELLKKEDMSKPSPYYFDTEGPNYIRTRWATDAQGNTISPKKEVLWPVEADGLPPVSRANFLYSKKHVRAEKVYYDGSLRVKLSARDAVSGVDSVMYSMDGNEYGLYTGVIPVPAHGDHVLRMYAIDKVGNTEKAKKGGNRKFFVDTAPPKTTHSVKGPHVDNILSPKAKILLNGTDPDSGLKRIGYGLGTASERNYIQPILLVRQPEGDEKLTYHGEDHVGNKEANNTFNFYLDRTAPVTTFSFDKDEYVSPKNYRFVSGRSQLALSAEDNKAGVAGTTFMLDSEHEEVYGQPVKAKYLSQELHTMYFYSTDKVENREKNKRVSFFVDKTKPVLEFRTSGPSVERKDTVFVRSITKVHLKASDPGKVASGVKSVNYFDNGEEHKYGGPFSFDEPYAHKLKVVVTDQVNNVDDFSKTYFVDDFAPEIFCHFSTEPISEKLYPNHVVLYLAGEDKHVGNDLIYYSINGDAEKLYTHPIRYFKAGKKIRIKIRALDYLGNEAVKTIKFSTEK
ncbi:hypothetical protein FUAX_01690 [Fulvitalea axinellae]|uniref:Ig-like domain-containing protein n=1 Tax=Fulvitalea axinellae TaxID=1182444 RepID=A0AAU9CIR2_9BACT|nr:hypothetical protein FUAX_01690 [Fulvitalea axinellae]